jgi:hypothetical protein
MHQYRVELRTSFGQSKFIDLMADDHRRAAYLATRQTGLLVLSTEFIA